MQSVICSVCCIARDRLEKGEELLELLDRKTARQQEQFQQYQTGGAAVREHCPHLTKEACRRARGQQFACNRLHQRSAGYRLLAAADITFEQCTFLGGEHVSCHMSSMSTLPLC